jgi:hypothetical protein
MRLNDEMPELPDWPFIDVMEGGSLVVHGRHISYGRYVAVRYLLRIVMLAGFYYVGREAIEERKIIPGLIEAVLMYFVPTIILWTLLPFPKWVCWLVFRTHTKVRFTAEAVIIGGKAFPANAGVEIRFGAFEPVLKDRDVQREQNHRKALYLLRFQKIQMIYGLRVVDIATIDDEYRAQQFAVMLQQAYFISRNDEERTRLADG